MENFMEIEELKFQLKKEYNQKLYENFMFHWNNLPLELQHKFRKEQECSLCRTCFGVLQNTQETVRADKMAKYNMEQNND